MKNNFDSFKTAIKLQESGGRYDVINQYGFLGAYQFGKPRLYDLGISIDGWHPVGKPIKKIVTKKDFLHNPGLQDYLFQKHCKQLLNIYNKRFRNKYDNKIIHGIKVTASGFIAGCHLVGLGGVMKYLSTGKDIKDGNGISVKEYMNKFSDYNLEELNS